jgi:hypothetical protein
MRTDSPGAGSGSLDRTVALHDVTLAHDLLVLRASVAECIVRGQGSVTVDMAGVTRLSSVAVAALLWARRDCGMRAVPFSVQRVMGNRNRQVLARCGLLDPPRGGVAS